jgi:hypothetical protein
MSNNDIIMMPMSSSGQSSDTNESTNNQNRMTTFRKRIRKHMPGKPIIATPSDKFQYDKKEQCNIDKSLHKISIKQTDKKIINSLVSVVYPTINETKILVASIPKELLFNFSIGVDQAVIVDSKIKIPLDRFKYDVANYLLGIPKDPKRLENKASKKECGVYNYYTECVGTKENTIINKQKMNTGSNCMIYTNGDINELSSILMDLTSNWSNSICVCSKEDLMSVNKLKELKKNEQLREMLDSCLISNLCYFSIFVNSIMPNLKTTTYLNFFNILPNDLEKIDTRNLKMIDMDKLLKL